MEGFDNEYGTITYDEDLEAISLVFKKQVPANDFIHLNQKLLEIFKTLSTNRFYVDARNIGIVAVEGQKWVIENLFKGMLDHLKGEKLYHAQLMPNTDIFGKAASSNIRVQSKSNYKKEDFIMESFVVEEEAKNWLKSK